MATVEEVVVVEVVEDAELGELGELVVVARKNPPPPIPKNHLPIEIYPTYTKNCRGSMSGGVIAGVVIGVVVGVILLLLLMWYLNKRQFEKKREAFMSKEALMSGKVSMEISEPRPAHHSPS